MSYTKRTLRVYSTVTLAGLLLAGSAYGHWGNLSKQDNMHRCGARSAEQGKCEANTRHGHLPDSVEVDPASVQRSAQ